MLKASRFADCTGDATVGFLAGADHEVTKENHLGASNLWNVNDAPSAKELLKCECTDSNALNTSVQMLKGPVGFSRCPWAIDLSNKSFPKRKPPREQPTTGLNTLGDWFWESDFDRDPIEDMEWVRNLNFRAMYGAWDALKNLDKVFPNQRLT